MGAKSKDYEGDEMEEEVEEVEEEDGDEEDGEEGFEELEAEYDDEEEEKSVPVSKSRKKSAKEHKEQLQRLQKKDPEFYKFLQEHDKELLDFDDEDIEDDDMEDTEMQVDKEIDEHDVEEEEEKPSKKVITTAMVDSWCVSIKENGQLGAVRSLMRAFRIACHYGDDAGDDSSMKFSIMSSSVFNKIMLFVLSEMDGILRKLLKLPSSGGKKETITDLMHTPQWKKHNHLVKSYLGNSLHVLNQMTDAEMISFTLRRLKYSSLFLVAFPSLLRKYVKVALHFWGTGGGALPVVAFLFLRDICIRLGSDCLDDCFRGIYKAYILNCHFINAVKLQHIQFLSNCVVELLGVDLRTAYQHAFVFIRQLAMILRDAFNVKTKEAFRKVYEWKFMNCLEVWTGAICAYGSEADFKPLAYPLTQIISGVAHLVPTARYFPLRLRCVKMLNRIAASTGTFIPVSLLLLDMLEMKELNRPPTGGVGKAVDLRTVLKVSKPIVKTRAFQEACVFSVVEELAEHLAQWSYSVSFFELSFIPVVRLRSFCKTTKVERFRKEMRELVRQIEANSKFTNERRMSINFQPNDPAAFSFLEDEKKSGSSPLSLYVATQRQKAKQRHDSLLESSVLVGEKSSIFGGKKIAESDEEEEDEAGNEPGAAVFSSSWLPGSTSKDKSPKEEKKEKKKKMRQEAEAVDEDVVEDLILSSDEDGSISDAPCNEDGSMSEHSQSDSEDENSKPVLLRGHSKKQKSANLSEKRRQKPSNGTKKNVRSGGKTLRKRKRSGKM
ncbi:nucleolar complex protein 2 homolog [Mangifera indica]|uniref:nucleolar complex protein 2 homolog n=1 Tax=Mangifera indica TaxID=29780 RepID=UPI001CFA2450|nr:nucleolar complex protein 2 homolog [Mangifera indica]XP_044483447.1 nucleolar complex protein 2 homolog [Mangifera indica]